MQTLLTIIFCASLAAAKTDFNVPGKIAFQDALYQAQSGDTITIDNTTTQIGNFVLPPKAGSSPITIRTSQFTDLPNRRINPSDAVMLAKIVSPNTSAAILIPAKSKGWRLLGLDVSSKVYAYHVIRLGEAVETVVADLPFDIDLDRLYVHADPATGGKRGVELNSGKTTIRNCYIAGFWSDQQDTQAIAGWNGTGPYDITNNYLEGSSENIMLGGAPSAIQGLIPSDIRIVGNHITKPISWFVTAAGAAPKQVKNLFELKNAQRVLVEGNVFENNWMQAQSGRAILFTVRVEGDLQPWAVVKDVMFRNNIVRNTAAGFSILGSDNASSADVTKAGLSSNIQIVNNTWDIGNPKNPWPTNNQGFMLILNRAVNIKVDHNTIYNTASDGIGTIDEFPGTGLTFTNNIVPINDYGLIAHGTFGVRVMDKFMPGYLFKRNVLITDQANAKSQYTSDRESAGVAGENFFPSTTRRVLADNGALVAGSPYAKKGTDGKDIGADMAAIALATKDSISGNGFYTTSLPPVPVPQP